VRKLVILLFLLVAVSCQGAGNDSYTVLLIHSNTASGSTTFTDSAIGGAAPHAIAVTGAVHTTAEAKFGTSSMWFDGTDDFLSISDFADFNFGSNAFTVDFWVHGDFLANSRIYLGNRTATGTDTMWSLAYYDNSTEFHTGLTQVVNNGNIPTGGIWNHIAIERITTATDGVRLYVNGVEGPQRGTLDDDMTGGEALLIGKDLLGLDYFHGYFDEIRISNGIARYQGNFAVATEAYSIVASETVTPTNVSFGPSGTLNFSQNTAGIDALLHLDGDYDDIFGNTWSGVSGNAGYLSADQTKFGSGSFYLPPTGVSGLSSLVPPTFSGTSTFSLDAWVYVGAATTTQSTVWLYNDDFNFAGLLLESDTASGSVVIQDSGGGCSYTVPLGEFPFAAWSHYEYDYDGSVLYVFQNGTLLATSSFPGGFATGTTVTFGRVATSGYDIYVDEWRYSNTVRHTDSFTVPSSPYAAEPILSFGGQP
jgi:hypothetical protein